MKTILPLLPLFLLASCSQPPPPSFAPWKTAGPHETAVAPAKPAHAESTATAQTGPAHTTQAAKPVVPTNSTAAVETGMPAPAAAKESQLTSPPAASAVAALPSVSEISPASAATGTTNGTLLPTETEASAGDTNLPSAETAATAPAGSNQAMEEVIPAGMIKFQNTPLDQVLQVYSQLVNRTLLRPANLQSPPITLETQTQLTKKEAIQALEAVLALNGITMINVGDKFVKVVPVAQAASASSHLNFTNNPAGMPELGQYVTHIVQLHYVKPSEVAKALTPFSTPGSANAIQAIDDSDILILRDYAENVKRMLEMVKKIDVAVPSEYISEVIPIKYAKAVDIANAINSVSTGGATTTVGGGAGSGTGQAGATGLGNMQRGVGYGSQYGSRYGSFGNQFRPQAVTPGAPATGNSFTARLQRIIQRASSSGELQILGQTKIIADERSNSLLVFATRQDMEVIKKIVAKLDVVLAQVLIQSIIMDVQLDSGWNVGVTGAQYPKQFTPSVAGGGGINNGQSFYSQFLSTISSATTNAFLGSLPGGFSYWAQLGKSFNLALQAAASDDRINVIQTPQIITTHAKTGRIFIGSTVPYITSTYYGGAYGGGPSSQYQQLSVGIGLDVTPYINADGLVVMEISEQISELSGSTAITGVGNVPNTSTRELEASVAVPDGDTVMLGGFIRNSSERKKSGVPLLKDIPLLGALFSNNSKTKERKELIVLLRPTVLNTPENAAEETGKLKSQLPGVIAAEDEVHADEKKEMEREQKRKAHELKESADHATPASTPQQPPGGMSSPDSQ